MKLKTKIYLIFVCVSIHQLIGRVQTTPESASGLANSENSTSLNCASRSIAVQLCESYINVPDCNGRKSTVRKFVDQLSKLAPCEISWIEKIIQRKLATFKASEEILCKNDLYKEFKSNKKCWSVAKYQMQLIARLVDGSHKYEQCSAANEINRIWIEFGKTIPNCYEPLSQYLKTLFNESPCIRLTTTIPY